jgi:trehalose 6-phosphate phosphatase
MGKMIPSALKNDSIDDLVRRSKKVALFLDYDGTLAQIVHDPSRAFISEKTRDALQSLTRLCTIGILSGRDVEAVRKFVGLKGVIYAGSHGFDIIMADGKRIDNPRWDAFLPSLDAAEKELNLLTKGIPGALVERKRFGIAVHYRMVDSAHTKEVREVFEKVASSFSRDLRTSEGKKVFELLPNVAWDKGKALLFLLRVLERDDHEDGKFLPVFIGDDLTDEDGFRVLRRRGMGILVSESGSKGREKKTSSQGTLARYFLRDPDEVRLFLEKAASLLREKKRRRKES